jgi:hypothetical protein
MEKFIFLKIIITEYDEFLETTKSDTFDLSIFGIKCSIIDKIMILLNKLK